MPGDIEMGLGLGLGLGEREESYAPTHFQDKKAYMTVMETKINNEIGFHFWNKYVSAAFWGYISLPLNLSITMLTALSTGQATTQNLLPQRLYVDVSIATLVISVLNTYFRPHVQMNRSLELMKSWNEMGCEFEKIYYSEAKVLEDVQRRIVDYEALFHKVNEFKKGENLDTQNVVTDLLYLVLRSCNCCLRNSNTWLALDEALKRNNNNRG